MYLVSNAAGWSALNEIESYWGPLSPALSYTEFGEQRKQAREGDAEEPKSDAKEPKESFYRRTTAAAMHQVKPGNYFGQGCRDR